MRRKPQRQSYCMREEQQELQHGRQQERRTRNQLTLSSESCNRYKYHIGTSTFQSSYSTSHLASSSGFIKTNLPEFSAKSENYGSAASLNPDRHLSRAGKDVTHYHKLRHSVKISSHPTLVCLEHFMTDRRGSNIVWRGTQSSYN